MPKQVHELRIVSPPTETVYYYNNYESGVYQTGVASPILEISTTINSIIGTNLPFDISADAAYRGTKGLKFDYVARNGYCNNCGVHADRAHKTGVNGVAYFQDDDGDDLVVEDAAAIGRTLTNVTNGFSRWEITGIESVIGTNDKLTLDLVGGPVDGSDAEFNEGDVVRIWYECDVDGIIGGDIARRSDCDLLYSYFKLNGNQNLYTAGLQTERQSLFKRVYLKPFNMVPNNHSKLGVWAFVNGGSVIPFSGAGGDSDEKLIMSLTVSFATGGNHFYAPGAGGWPADFELTMNQWYYMEQECTPESSDGAQDGTFRWWFAEAGSEDDPLLFVEHTNVDLSPCSAASLWGNNPHGVDFVSGGWYIDEVKISDQKIGAA